MIANITNTNLMGIVIPALLFLLAAWLIYTAIKENRKAKPFSLRSALDAKQPDHGLDAMLAAGRFIIGIGIMLYLLLKVLY